MYPFTRKKHRPSPYKKQVVFWVGVVANGKAGAKPKTVVMTAVKHDNNTNG
jgi:hypothetical protein